MDFVYIIKYSVILKPFMKKYCLSPHPRDGNNCVMSVIEIALELTSLDPVPLGCPLEKI